MADIYNSKIARFMKWVTKTPNDYCFGITTGPVTTRYSGSIEQVSTKLRLHEDQHKRQYEAYGSRLKFWWAYLIMNIKYGYNNNPFEIEARKAETYVQ